MTTTTKSGVKVESGKGRLARPLLGALLSIFAGNASAWCELQDTTPPTWFCIAPTVSLTSPANGATYVFPASIPVTAAVDNQGQPITKVDFYVNNTLFRTVTAAPYSVIYTPSAPGAYTFKAIVTETNHGTRIRISGQVTGNADNPPTITIAPNASIVTYPGSFTFTANASDSDGFVTGVAYYLNGSTNLGAGAGANWSLSWAPPAAGSYSITGVATDNLGVTTTSAVISIRSNTAPTVSLTSPAAGAVFQAPATITLTANSADTDGNVARVDFLDGGTPVGTATAAPYSVTLANVAAGVHTLTARATDNLGGTTTSAAVSVTVDAPPVVNLTAPANNAIFASPATIALSASATDAVGTITRVDFYQGTSLIGSVTAVPYNFSWSGVAAGVYSLSAVATNDAGMTSSSSAVTVTVDAPPTVAISSPANGATFIAPATINLAANATDTVGTVTKVDFYQGGSLIGTANAAPFTFTWTNVAVGNYALTAIATNDAGSTTTAAPVAITVNSGVGVAQTYYIHPDHLDTTRLIQDQAGNTVWRWDQGEPFGSDVPNNNPSGQGAFDFPLRFPGQYFDREIGLLYNSFRDYDPAIGRYIQSDPTGLQGGTNTYVYVLGDPLGLTDPTGEVAGAIAGAVAGGVIGGIAGGIGAAQNPSATAGQIAIGIVGGAITGAGIGALAGSSPMGIAIAARVGLGFISNLEGQAIAGWGDPCFQLNFAGAIGAGISAGFFGTMNASTIAASGASSILGRIAVGTPTAVSQGVVTGSIGNLTRPSRCECR